MRSVKRFRPYTLLSPKLTLGVGCTYYASNISSKRRSCQPRTWSTGRQQDSHALAFSPELFTECNNNAPWTNGVVSKVEA